MNEKVIFSANVKSAIDVFHDTMKKAITQRDFIELSLDLNDYEVDDIKHFKNFLDEFVIGFDTYYGGKFKKDVNTQIDKASKEVFDAFEKNDRKEHDKYLFKGDMLGTFWSECKLHNRVSQARFITLGKNFGDAALECFDEYISMTMKRLEDE